jgi:hypothetical protein
MEILMYLVFDISDAIISLLPLKLRVILISNCHRFIIF